MTRLRQKYKKLKKAYEIERIRAQRLYTTRGINSLRMNPMKLSVTAMDPSFWLCGTVREELDLESERKYIEKEAALKFVQQLLEHDMILKQIDGQYIRYELRILAPTDWEREMFKAGGIV